MSEDAKWYVLSVLPQHELSVRDKILALAKNKAYSELIFDCKVHSEFIEQKSGKTKEKPTKAFARYVFVKMIHNDVTYNAVKVSGVLHIIGSPTPMTENEVKNFLI